MKIVVKVGLLCALAVMLPSSDAFAKATGALRKVKLKCAAEVGALTKNGKSWKTTSRGQLKVFYACVEREGGPKMSL